MYCQAQQNGNCGTAPAFCQCEAGAQMCGKFGRKCRRPRKLMIRSMPVSAAGLVAYDLAWSL